MFLAVLLNWHALSPDVPDLWQWKTEGLFVLLYVQTQVGKITTSGHIYLFTVMVPPYIFQIHFQRGLSLIVAQTEVILCKLHGMKQIG